MLSPVTTQTIHKRRISYYRYIQYFTANNKTSNLINMFGIKHIIIDYNNKQREKKQKKWGN